MSDVTFEECKSKNNVYTWYKVLDNGKYIGRIETSYLFEPSFRQAVNLEYNTDLYADTLIAIANKLNELSNIWKDSSK